MKLGAWIHDHSDGDAGREFEHAARSGIASVRGYGVDYSERVAPLVREHGLSLLAGIHVDSAALVEDWRTQVKLDELERTVKLDAPLEAICVGNELREGGDAWESKRFTSRLSYGLVRVLEAYHEWLAREGVEARLTYAMEGIVFDEDGSFKEHLWPLIDELDVVSLNLYPMTEAHWRDFTAFDVSAAFLRENRPWRRQMSAYEAHLRRVMEVLEAKAKPVFLSEMGFTSGVDYRIEGMIDGKDHVRPVHDEQAFESRMREYVELLASVSRDYEDRLEAVYFYEWWDNHSHSKIWNIEQSPIHTCFGLCDHEGREKLDVAALVSLARG
ncbi:MAG: hypothetical protein ACOC1U_01235 [Spirochaetota bacterium]